ncbi:MAG TPA: protein kinase, partial [Blastocatellia bacterium]|nr:protein kinase [Blastocatellia bacterium]
MISGLTRYRIIEKVGAGGMGEVYMAEDLALLRIVAIKVMIKNDSPSADLRFLREARLASQINHPHIVTVYEVGETPEHAYIVMEYVEGRSLRDLILARDLKADTVIEIALQIADAMAEAHSRGIIHRDIKPENIMVTARGRAKLLDFGLAKNSGGVSVTGSGSSPQEDLTESGVVMGTLSHMSPEQLRNQPLDARTDIFSFGIVLYEMVTGRLPFQGANQFEIAASILRNDPLRPVSLVGGLPDALVQMILRTLEKDREQRPASFAEIRSGLETIKRNLTSPVLTQEITVEMNWADSLGDIYARASDTGAAARRRAPTILVMPLEAMDAGAESSFIGIGLAHAITTDLAKINGLAVLSKAAGAGRRDEAGRGARDVARSLGATILLEGEVMRASGMLGVMARLTDVETGRVIWGAQYRGDASDLFSIQDAVCESVAAALKVSISSEVRDQIARPATVNIDAFELYSKGRALLDRRDVKANVDSAIRLFEEAFALDQAFALAYAGLGEAYWIKYEDTRDQVWVERAIAACDHALVLDPYQERVHISLGIVYHGTGRIDRAIEEFKNALALQPSSDAALRWLGQCYTRKGDMERSVDYFEKAIEIRPGYWDNYNWLGTCYYVFGRYQDAAEQFRRVIMIQPDNWQGYDKLGVLYILLGQYREAVAMHERAIEICPNETSFGNLGTAYFYLERYADAVSAYSSAIELNPRDDVLHRNLGDAYLRVGKEAEAVAQFQTAIKLLSEQLSVNPDGAQCLADLAICYAKVGNIEDSRERIERATALEPHNT